jgi:hypothetical protein
MNVRAAAVVPSMQLFNVSGADETFAFPAEYPTNTWMRAYNHDQFKVGVSCCAGKSRFQAA